MSAPRRPGSGNEPLFEGDPAMDALLEYLAATALAPAPDLASRVQARIALEPDRTPAGRFLRALVHLRLATALGAFRQLVRVAGGKGSFPALVRAQALGLVLVTALSAVALGVGAAASVQRVISERRDPAPTQPVPTLPSPTDRPTLVPDASTRPSEDPRSPNPSLPEDSPLTHPTPTPDATQSPAAQGDRPGRTQQPGNDKGSGSVPNEHATPRPEPTRTPRPAKTPRPEPTRTPRPAKTPHPTRRPEPTDRPEPTETPDSNDGGGSGADETDPPEGVSVWSGGVVLAGLVPPSWAFPPEGPA